MSRSNRLREASSRFLGCKRGNAPRAVRYGRHHLHFLPVIGQFLAAIETDHIGARQGRGAIAPQALTNRKWKAVMGMPTTEKRVEKPGDHTESSPEPYSDKQQYFGRS